MAVEQLPGQVREFARYLNNLMSRLDQAGGWCAVFWQRDPEGMRACLDGWEVPPWDVVQALLQDVAAEYGERAAAQEHERAKALHVASLTAYDTRPGGRDALGDRLDVMLREQRYAAERLSELGRLLRTAATREEAEAIRLDLAWARDDHDRATARCAELRDRMEQLDRRVLGGHAQGAPTVPQGGGSGVVFRVDEPRRDRDHGRAHGQGGGHDGGGGGGRDGGRDGARDRAERVGAQRRPAPDEDDWPDLWRDAAADRAAAQAAERAADQAAEQAAAARAADRAAARTTAPAPGPSSGPPSASQQPAPAPSQSADAFPSAPSPQSADASAPSPAAPEGDPPPPEPAKGSKASKASGSKQRSKRRARGGARFAGMMDEEATAAAAPAMPAPPTAERTLRGARFAGVAEEAERPKPRREPLDDEARRTTVQTVEHLLRLRSEGRTGEAHALLVEAAHWPAARFPLLAAELHRAGLDADWATLLWEAASLPADRLVAAADALVAAGRTADGDQMLRQGVVRPAREIGEAVLALVDEGRQREVRSLLDAYVRIRTPEESARSVEADPARLIPLLLEAAHHVSQQRHWDLIHALRVAGHTA